MVDAWWVPYFIPEKVEFSTKVNEDEQSLVQLINYNMELGRMISTMAKNVFWVKTLLHYELSSITVTKIIKR